VNVTVGETSDEARHLVGSVKGFYARLARVRQMSEAGKIVVPSPEAAAAEMTQAEKDEPTDIVAGQWPRFVAGNPSEVRATLEQMAEESGADEIIVQNMIAD